MNDKKQISEEILRATYLRKFQSEKEPLFCEVPVFNRSVDLVKLNSIEMMIHAIEFKTTDWARAIKQLHQVELSFDFLEVCILKPQKQNTQKKMVNVFRENGIGLTMFDQEKLEFIKAVEPQKVNVVWGIQKESILNYIGEMKKNGEKNTQTC